MQDTNQSFADGAAVVVINSNSKFRGWIGSVQSTRNRGIAGRMVGVNFNNGVFGSWNDVPFTAAELETWTPNEDDEG